MDAGLVPGNFVEERNLDTVVGLISRSSQRDADKAEEWRRVAEDQQRLPRRSLHAWEGHLLHQAGTLPPATRIRRWVAAESWRRANPAAASGDLLDIEIEEARMKMTDEERAEPPPPRQLHGVELVLLRRWERELAAYDGPPPPPPRNNSAGRKRWWSAPGRNLEAVLEHIQGGNFPVLTMPAPSRASASRRRGNVSHGAWLPARRLPDRRRGHPWRR
ncbi:hypothetical protein QYE76_020920 [Lolium multiflorum]|uniref:Uncharacterized protein n=1 Tax=Lolium multiflorum TaxID=4521 RepID=A0AAD8R9U0_LOLMU|nr:hypothetical protein QYE76_020920 [Lolium multiflorum]